MVFEVSSREDVRISSLHPGMFFCDFDHCNFLLDHASHKHQMLYRKLLENMTEKCYANLVCQKPK